MNAVIEEIADKLPQCFGSTDLEFASHPLEIESAKEVLQLVLENNLPSSSFKKLIKRYLESKGASSFHIDEQIEKALLLETYLDD